MRTLVLLSIVFAVAFAGSFEHSVMTDLFSQWKVAHGKTYEGFENEVRFSTFVENYLSILEFNSEQDDVVLGLNQFADLTADEFGLLYTGLNKAESTGPYYIFDDIIDPPASVDWRTKGAVTPVKNQGACGSCWAFSAVGALEGLNFIQSGNLLSFSEQQLVDCVSADQGCNGGLPTDAFAYTAQAVGIETETDYPYTAKDGKCAFDYSKAHDVNSGYFNVTPANLNQMKLGVATQPVSVGIQANQLVFQFYTTGVIKKYCGDTLDHGVLVVGYGTVNDVEAFYVKNSWGSGWGVSGYVNIGTDPTANKGNGVCGILSMPAYPTKS